MTVRVTLLTMTLCTIAFLGLSQNMEKMHKKAQDHFYHDEFYEAMDEYQKILKKDTDNGLVQYRMTICSLLTKYRRQVSIEEVFAFKESQGKEDKFYNYWLGRVYYRQGNFKKAIETWIRFLNIEKYKSAEIIAETKDFIKNAERAELQYSHPQNFEIEQLSPVINSSSTEFSPVYFRKQDELLFLSSKNSSASDERFMAYHSFREDKTWSKPTPVNVLGEFTASNANIEVVNNGGKLYLYRSHGHKGDIYYTEKSANKWLTPLKLDIGLPQAKLESHFHINEKENRILFAHYTTAGHRDNFDIYECRLDPTTGKWSKPSIFATEINSEKDEDFPFLSDDEKTIYFSSKGFESLGGYDVYKSEWSDAEEKWSEPVSLKYPTNSIDDDIQFRLDEETGSGYFVSNRIDTYGGFDIFFFHESAKVMLTGVVTDGKGNPANHAQIQFFPSKENGLMLKTMTDEEGKYRVLVGNDDQIKVDIYFHDELSHTEVITTPHAGNEEVNVVLDFSLADEKMPAKPEPIIVADPQFTTVENIGSKFRQINKVKLSNIYFHTGSAELTESNSARLSGLLKALRDYKKLRIEIAGHTDNVGNSEFNLELSKQRALAVANYLNSRGISADRLKPKGYGDTQPLASNDDEKDGRELNRRIEVVVIE